MFRVILLLLLSWSFVTLFSQNTVFIGLDTRISVRVVDKEYENRDLYEDLYGTAASFSYSFGWRKQISENWAFSADAEWRQWALTYDISHLSFGAQIDERRGFIFQSQRFDTDWKEVNRYVAAQLSAERKIIHFGQYHIWSTLGLSHEWYVNTRSREDHIYESTYKTPRTIAGRLGLSASRTLGDRFFLSADAHYARQLSSAYPNPDQEGVLRYRYLGIGMGIRVGYVFGN